MKKLLYLFVILIIVLAFLLFRPVPIVTEDKALTTVGVVSSISEGGVKDIVFRLENHPTRYYINRGLEQGFQLEALKEKLTGQEVTIKYPKYGLPFLGESSLKHLSKLEFGDEVVFNELN